MSHSENERIARDPRFQKVANGRNRLAWTLFAITMLFYFSLVLTAAFNPDALARPFSEGSTMTIGWPIGALVIIIPWLFTIYYVRRANADGREMNRIVQEVLK